MSKAYVSVLRSNAAFSLAGSHLCFHDWNWRFPVAELKLAGRHMMANALAATGMRCSWCFSTKAAEEVFRVLRDFRTA
jgi:UDP-N-acetylmuramyl tripeptide synthase